MEPTTTHVREDRSTEATPVAPWVSRGPLVVVVGSAVAYVLAVLPFFANGLDELPWRMPDGPGEPGDWSRYTTGITALDYLWILGIFLAIWLGLLVNLLAAGWALAVVSLPALRRTLTHRQQARTWLAIVLAAGLIWYHVTPLAEEIRAWVMD